MTELDKAVQAWEINQFLGASHRFRQTVLRLPREAGGSSLVEFVRDKFEKKGARRPTKP